MAIQGALNQNEMANFMVDPSVWGPGGPPATYQGGPVAAGFGPSGGVLLYNGMPQTGPFPENNMVPPVPLGITQLPTVVSSTVSSTTVTHKIPWVPIASAAAILLLVLMMSH